MRGGFKLTGVDVGYRANKKIVREELMAAASSATRDIALSKIRIDGDTQVRVELNQFVIDTYAEDMKQGDTFPPIVLFSERSSFWLGDGWHRVGWRKRSRTNEAVWFCRNAPWQLVKLGTTKKHRP